MLRFMGLQRVGHVLVTEQHCSILILKISSLKINLVISPIVINDIVVCQMYILLHFFYI